MSEWQPQVVRLEKIERHPAADTLEISHIFGGYTVIFKEGRFKEGDLAGYIPVDTICSDHPEFDWLGDKKRIKAMRLRGVFSMGILATAPEGMVEGDSIVEYYGLKKHVYEEEMPDVPGRHNAEHASPPKNWSAPHYDLEGLRKFKDLLKIGEEVIITEKLEGCNASFSKDDEGVLWVKSRNYYLKEDDANLYWQAAKKYNLAEVLKPYPGKVFFAEVYGQVKKFRYDCVIEKNILTPKLRFFDVWDTKQLKYLDWDDASKFILEAGLETVPVLYRGPWTGDDLWNLAEGNSIIGSHPKEGLVIRPVINRNHFKYGREIFKLKGEAYYKYKG